MEHGATIVEEVNRIDGKGPKFDYLQKAINELKFGKILDVSKGNGPKSNELEQAVKDMKDVNDTTGNILKSLKIEDTTKTNNNED